MDKTWVVIADAQRARCFERHGAHHPMTELAGFVHPHPSLIGLAEGGDLTGAAGKGHGNTGHAGTQFEPHTDAHAKARARFANELAVFINKGVSTQQCNSLVLIAPGPMLGEIKPFLSPAAHSILTRSVVSDLTHYTGLELARRVGLALALPD